MSRSAYVRTAVAQAALEHTAPLIRQSLLGDARFREEYHLITDAVLAFGDSGVSIQRSELLDAIREVLLGASESEITDTNGREWKLRNEAKNGNFPRLVITGEKQRLVLPDFAVLSPDSRIRLRKLDEASSDVNLPVSAQEFWRDLLAKRPLEDDEIDEFHSDLHDTPVQIARSVRREIETGQSSVSSLVPYSRRYFERLVGVYDGSASIKDYAAGAGREFFQQLFAWRPYDGFLHSLLVSSHLTLTAELGVEQLEREDLVRAYDFLAKNGDRTSQLGGIEVALRILPDRPEIEPFIRHLIEQVRDDDIVDATSGFNLFSALFVLVDGELSRTRLLAEEPPFYRRLASLSQAALVHRQLVNFRVDDKFCEWACTNRFEQYYMQSLADMRLEPRWNPDLAAASQIKAEFFGRIIIAATNHKTNIEGGELHDLILGAGPDSLNSLCVFPLPYLPGPLEGAEDSPNALPADVSEAIEAQLKTDEVGPTSFVALVNSAMIFRIDLEQAELAANSLRLGNYRLAKLKDKSELLGVLNGLATVAAAARSPTLADELRILVRRYRRDAQFSFSIEEAMRICLMASASRDELNEWREFAGEWITELAFDEFEVDEGNVLHSQLQCLFHAVPELWVTCARADAALRAFNAR